MYRWVEHTGEVELEIAAPTERAVFEHALVALADLLHEGATERRPDVESSRRDRRPVEEAVIEREIVLHGGDLPTLLAEWISELAFLAETEQLVPLRVASLELGADGLGATVEARPGRPPHLVKAATYHRLSFEPAAAGGWRARVVLDV